MNLYEYRHYVDRHMSKEAVPFVQSCLIKNYMGSDGSHIEEISDQS